MDNTVIKTIYMDIDGQVAKVHNDIPEDFNSQFSYSLMFIANPYIFISELFSGF